MSKVNFDNIPYELIDLDNWVCWIKEIQENGKWTKKPIDANTGYMAKSNDRNTWCDYETAEREAHKYDGIGFMMGDGVFGIDIDGVGNEVKEYLDDPQVENIVSEFVDLMQSYAEISPSGKGIHIIAKGELPEGTRRKGNVEMYSEKRFLTVTGNRIGNYTSVIEDEMNKVNYLHQKYLYTPVIERKSLNSSSSYGATLSKEKIIEIALKSKKATRFNIFLHGGWDGFFDSQSEADMAFCNDLAFWTNCDYQMMDDIFRGSSMMRDKWDRPQNNSTYGDETLNKAINDCANTFIPQDDKVTSVDGNVQEIKKKYYSYDDTGNAQRLRDSFGDNIRFSYDRKSWFFYEGKIWKRDNMGMIKNLVDTTIENMKEEDIYYPPESEALEVEEMFKRHIKRTRSSSGKSNMIKETEHLLPITPEQFDTDINLFNVQNGFIDLETSTLYEHDREKYFTKISNVEFTDKIDCPLWLKFLDEIFDGNQDLISYIQRCVGYSLSGSTEEQMMFFLHGAGRNGKSVLLDIINEIFGNYSTNIQPQTIMVKQQSGGANSDVARLDGARLVTTTEPNEGVRLDEGLVKQLTGGDKVTARFLHENEFDFTPQFKIWMATNHKPYIRGTDDGIWRRLAIIPFEVQIPLDKIDYQLKNKLKGELSGILNWAVKGYSQWKAIGLKEPECVAEQRKEYRLEMDSIESFIEQRCVRESNARSSSAELFAEYDWWAEKNNEHRISSNKFGREMTKKFKKIKSGNVYFLGVKLKPKEENMYLKRY